jgi:hypothetical protein
MKWGRDFSGTMPEAAPYPLSEHWLSVLAQENFSMKRFALTVALLSCSLSLHARADDWSKTYSIAGTPDLRIETTDANIHVDTWDQKTIEVHVTTTHYKIGEGGIKIYEHQNGDAVEIEVRYPHQVFYLGFKKRVDVDVHMPRQGRAYLRTGDGDIRLSGLKGAMEVQSGDGGEDITGVDGTVRAHTGDGHIRAEGRFDQIDLSSGDGRIEARALAGSRATADWNIRTGDGSVTLQLPDNFAANVNLHTGDGHISLDMPVTVEGSLKNNDIRGRLNGGGSLLTIHTGDGSIRLERS